MLVGDNFVEIEVREVEIEIGESWVEIPGNVLVNEIDMFITVGDGFTISCANIGHVVEELVEFVADQCSEHR
ncbi:hypothetical protein C493_06979 [Natronolimnohabitans innermongolicus JCM 12255]|uniref:Uncharacterized protein n=1 Tax=Natronolimnohabitans innermongolicus JCM 12255 TaxID=1227499 RepID=L9X966_9EURY|nr:hypothetical protein C493_06979 [Natronolimnohabitans innermongolicus JCM 12255]